MNAPLEIIQAPDPLLNKVCDPVNFDDPETHSFAVDLVATLVLHNGKGLAAPQVGRTIRMFAMKYGAGVTVMCNPQIVRRGRETARGDEGCLSIRHGRPKFTVTRHKLLTVEWFTVHGVRHSQKMRGFDARCVQHEIDHLNGVLIE